MMKTCRRILSAVLALCLCSVMLPAISAVETVNEAGLPIEPIELSTAAREQSSGRYGVSYTAKLDHGVGNDYANIVVLNMADAASLKSLRFTCTLTDRLIEQMQDAASLQQGVDFTFDGGSIYTFLSASKSGSTITIQYKLNEAAVNRWGTARADDVKREVMTAVSMRAERTVTAAQMNAALRGGSTITSSAEIVLSVEGGGSIPGCSGYTSLLVAQGTAKIDITPYVPGGETVSYPVEVKEQTHGSVEADCQRAAAGTRVSVTPTPDAGYRVCSVVVTDERGNRVPVTANADGTYSFIMPNGKVEVQVSFGTALATPEETGVSRLLNTDEHTAFMLGHADGSFAPNGDVTRAQVAMMFYRLLRNQDVSAVETFTDVPANAWYAKAVDTLAALGIVNGVGGGKYAPERPITRAEFCAIAVRFAETRQESTVVFADVPSSFWAYEQISAAAAYGWVLGVGNGRFAPNDKITRAQAAAIVNRMTGRLADQAAIDCGEGARFPDVANTHWAWYDIIEASTAHDYQKNSDNTAETWIDWSR